MTDALRRPASVVKEREAQRRPGANPSETDIETIIREYGDDILRLCLLYLGDRYLAEDAFQVTVTKAWQQLPAFRGESGVKTWVSHIAVNVCRDMLRSGWLHMLRKSEPIESLLDLAAPEQGGGELTQAVLNLPGKYREVIVLYYYENMKMREIAEALGLPVNSVSTRLRRARTMLGDMVKGDEAL
ncbi:MAG: sigma-70 family RNA polymerase sigma factor [Clostridia bacterium]|nr:sigma-70 family RNA polymerase sigma factor [Clostridia bacterium]